MAVNSFRPRKYEDHEIVDGNKRTVPGCRWWQFAKKEMKNNRPSSF